MIELVHGRIVGRDLQPAVVHAQEVVVMRFRHRGQGHIAVHAQVHAIERPDARQLSTQPQLGAVAQDVVVVPVFLDVVGRDHLRGIEQTLSHAHFAGDVRVGVRDDHTGYGAWLRPGAECAGWASARK